MVFIRIYLFKPLFEVIIKNLAVMFFKFQVLFTLLLHVRAVAFLNVGTFNVGLHGRTSL